MGRTLALAALAMLAFPAGGCGTYLEERFDAVMRKRGALIHSSSQSTYYLHHGTLAGPYGHGTSGECDRYASSYRTSSRYFDYWSGRPYYRTDVGANKSYHCSYYGSGRYGVYAMPHD